MNDLFSTRLYGGKAFSYILKEIRSGKISARSEEVIFFGIDCGNAYDILLRNFRNIIIYKDVSFNESSAVMGNLEDVSSSRIKFELPRLKAEHFGDAEIVWNKQPLRNLISPHIAL